MRRRRAFPWVSLGLVVLVIGLGFSFVYLANLPRLAIKELRIKGTHLLAPGDLLAVAEQSLEGKYLGLINKNNFFLYPRERLSAALLSRFDKLAVAESQTDYGGVLTVRVREHEAAALWCVLDSVGAKTCHFLDETGLAFAPAPKFSGPVLFEITASRPAELGSFPLPAALWDKVFSLVRKLPEALPAELVAAPEIYRAELISLSELKLWLKGRGETEAKAFPLLVKMSDPLEYLVETLRSGLASREFLAEIKGHRADLEYLDLRFGDKIFYRFMENLL